MKNKKSNHIDILVELIQSSPFLSSSHQQQLLERLESFTPAQHEQLYEVFQWELAQRKKLSSAVEKQNTMIDHFVTRALHEFQNAATKKHHQVEDIERESQLSVLTKKLHES